MPLQNIMSWYLIIRFYHHGVLKKTVALSVRGCSVTIRVYGRISFGFFLLASNDDPSLMLSPATEHEYHLEQIYIREESDEDSYFDQCKLHLRPPCLHEKQTRKCKYIMSFTDYSTNEIYETSVFYLVVYNESS